MVGTLPRARSRIHRKSLSESSMSRGDISEGDNIEDHLIHAQNGVRELKRKLAKLRGKVAVTNDSPSYVASTTRTSKLSRRNSTTDDDTSLTEIRIKNLEGTVEKLKKENQIQMKQIKKLKAKRFQEEVDDLQVEEMESDRKFSEIDPIFRMRKLLRRFSDLVMVSTIPEDMTEECPICFERFVLKKCSALTCGHIICHDCLPKVMKGADETIKCPDCRNICPREELELVHLTEQERWDALLDAAKAWMAYDKRGEQETSEEEEEEDFLTDGNGTSELTSEAGNLRSQTIEETSSEGGRESIGNGNELRQASTPPPTVYLPFSESPTKLKRKRMEELAEQRSQKRRT